MMQLWKVYWLGVWRSQQPGNVQELVRKDLGHLWLAYINRGSQADFLQATVDVSPLKVRHYKGGSCFVQPVNGKQVSLDCLWNKHYRHVYFDVQDISLTFEMDNIERMIWSCGQVMDVMENVKLYTLTSRPGKCHSTLKANRRTVPGS